ncbi:hypothetical protein B0H19DRAFT_1202270 [Mycena capillaripes]|nr:hypothetical protein B0H19DRAFT_1202270 [Mycena capillaripes]
MPFQAPILCIRCSGVLGGVATSLAAPCDGCGNICLADVNAAQDLKFGRSKIPQKAAAEGTEQSSANLYAVPQVRLHIHAQSVRKNVILSCSQRRSPTRRMWDHPGTSTAIRTRHRKSRFDSWSIPAGKTLPRYTRLDRSDDPMMRP